MNEVVILIRKKSRPVIWSAPQLVVGDHLQQEQRGGVAAGAAVLPPAGPAVPRLPVGRLQVCLRVPRLFDRAQP